jgi:uncharacterized protein (TIGR02996 family)
VATREELEAQIAAAPYDDAAFEIYGDLLQQLGDPRGELIAIDSAAARTLDRAWQERRRALLEAHPALAPPHVAGIELTWHLGFVRRVTLVQRSSSVTPHPAYAFVTELAIARDLDAAGTGSLARHLATLAAQLPLLRRLELGDPYVRHWARGAELPIDLDIDLLGQLEHLFAQSPVRFAAAPRLRSLELLGMDAPALEWLAGVPVPALERLSLGFRTPSIVSHAEQPVFARVEELRPLLASPPPRLQMLELIDLPCGDELVRELTVSPLLRQLRVLRLWNADLTRDAARHLTTAAYGHLAELDLSDPLLDDELASRLGAAPGIRTSTPLLDALLRRSGYAPG